MDRLEPTITSLYSAGFGVIGQPNFTSNTGVTTQSGLLDSTGVAINSAGNLYVSDGANSRVLIFNPPFSNGMNASVVIGQPNFTSNTPALTQSGLDTPRGVTFDSAGNLYVSDLTNRRVLIFNPPFSNGMNASVVIGQPNFTSNTGVTTQSGLDAPRGVAIDSAGNLYVSDLVNSRVLIFNPPFSNGMNASVVIGQPNFTSNTPALTQSGLDTPYGVAIDSAGNLYVSDNVYSRVLIFNPPFSNGMNASVVIGQPNFTSNTPALTQSGLDAPRGVAIDSAGNLYVSDGVNSRVLIFNPPFSNGMNASVVIGQPNFTSNTPALTQSGLHTPYGVAIDSAGNLYVSDNVNNRVVMFHPPFSNGMNASDTNASTYSSIVYPGNRKVFYVPNSGISKI